ncbi:Uncharacterised protein [Vibrio cholerae]|uniref:Uncharacterized protein n=1 Tax=Vibrio cholerae TaxID=666 RepID=A0A655ZNB4_VIBCL|nr:Uncharacterised protein [Vibrio cholerae]CSC74831.1 Uncharacterised protein [Vibrio cholerae]CSC85048.1 Uncharacterised protein [Vibrio cholerae]CSD17391.1 Uncharacterised protein [Vibrio cholerae]
MQSHAHRHLRTDDRKHNQPQRIKTNKQAFELDDPLIDPSGQYARDTSNRQIFRILYPAEWVVAQQNIAHCTTANRSSAGNQHDAKPVHFATAGTQGSGHGFRRDPNDIQNTQQHASPHSTAEDIYPSYLKLQRCWRRSLSLIAYLCS